MAAAGSNGSASRAGGHRFLRGTAGAAGTAAGGIRHAPSAKPAAFRRAGTAVLGCLLALACIVGTSAPVPQNPLGPQIAFAEGIGDENLVDPTQRADNSFIYDTTVASLFSQASLYNGRTVQVVGEVIGDRIRAGDDKSWITLTETNADDKSSISVLVSADQANQISHYGRYGVEGTTLQVRGTYHQACDEHDGLPDIHVTTSSVQAAGADQPDTFRAGDLVPGMITLIIGVALMGAFYLARERTR